MIIEIRELASNRNKKSPLGDLGEKKWSESLRMYLYLTPGPSPKERGVHILLE
jgi:hypothetical protein